MSHQTVPPQQYGRSRSLPRVRAGHLQAPPPLPMPPAFPKQHSCYRHKVVEKEKEKERQRALDGRMDMGHRSLRPCRQRNAQSQGPAAEKAAAAGGAGIGTRGSGRGRRGPVPIEERPPFNLNTRIEGEDEVDELTGKYVRRKENNNSNKGAGSHQHSCHAFGGGPNGSQLGGSGEGDPTANWANSLRESFHRGTVKMT